MLDQCRRSANGHRGDALRVCRREVLPKATILRLEGEIDLSATPVLEDSLTTALDRGVHVIVDMKDVRYLDASLYRVLARVRGRRAPHQRVVLVGLTPFMQKTVKILGLQRVVDITTSVEVAKRWLEIC